MPLLFLVLPNYPSTTKWLTATEKDAIIASRAAQGNTGHQQHFQREYLVVTLTREYSMLPSSTRRADMQTGRRT